MAKIFEGKTASGQLTGKTVSAPVPKKVVVPTVLQASPTVAKKQGSILDVGWAALQVIANRTTFGLVPLAKPEAPKQMVTTKPFVPTLTAPQKAAITQAVQLKYGQAVVSSPANQAMIAKLRTRAILGEVSAKGYELAPKGTSDYLYNAETQAAQFRDAYNILLGQQEEWTGKQSEYLSRISEHEAVLAKSTQELGTLKTKYSNLESAYYELLNKPPSGDGGQVTPLPDLFGGLGDFIKTYGIWIALGVGAIFLLPPLLNAFGGKK